MKNKYFLEHRKVYRMCFLTKRILAFLVSRRSQDCLATILLFCLCASCAFFVNNSANQICFKYQCIEIELAMNEEDRMRGLQLRTSLANNSGMLFIFPDSQQYKFWMKDTFIPLDIIWINDKNHIVHIEHNVQPCEKDPCPTYSSPKKAKYVLEINAGHADKLGIQAGDKAENNY